MALECLLRPIYGLWRVPDLLLVRDLLVVGHPQAVCGLRHVKREGDRHTRSTEILRLLRPLKEDLKAEFLL